MGAGSSSPPMETSKTPILCVDDEPHVLAGLSLNLGRRYQVQTATSGAAALDLLRQSPQTAVIVSDMRMPGMDGATFLRLSIGVAPSAMRVLLTGHADLPSAIEAVNEGKLFRFLTKPCPTATMVATIDAAAEQVRLLAAERVLLEQTLHGSIKVLTDVLALTNQAAFGRANRLRRLAGDLAAAVGLAERWQLEVAAMLSQLGSIALPEDVLDRLHRGEPLAEAERQMVERSHEVTERLLAHIPRLEGVRAILRMAASGAASAGATECEHSGVAQGAELLRVLVDYDALEAQGVASARALATLRGRAGRYEVTALEALAGVCGEGSQAEDVRELPVTGLRAGMVLADDVRNLGGVLLAAKGCEVTASFVERMRNFGRTVREPIRVVLPREP